MKEIEEHLMDLLKQEQFQYQMLKKALVNCIVKESYSYSVKLDLDKLITILSVIEPIYVLEVEAKIKEIKEGEKQ